MAKCWCGITESHEVIFRHLWIFVLTDMNLNFIFKSLLPSFLHPLVLRARIIHVVSWKSFTAPFRPLTKAENLLQVKPDQNDCESVSYLNHTQPRPKRRPVIFFTSSQTENQEEVFHLVTHEVRFLSGCRGFSKMIKHWTTDLDCL